MEFYNTKRRLQKAMNVVHQQAHYLEQTKLKPENEDDVDVLDLIDSAVETLRKAEQSIEAAVAALRDPKAAAAATPAETPGVTPESGADSETDAAAGKPEQGQFGTVPGTRKPTNNLGEKKDWWPW